MSFRFLNLGILAHVDAGKTSLTERLLFETGVIRRVGSVDSGTTQTDTLELERARGITIQSAVVSFSLGDLTVNLIDTPGHPDFIAEVVRSLRVLDAVILVVSAVEGVQPQTRRLAHALQVAGVPRLIFVNKIDRVGAREAALLEQLTQALRMRVLPMNRVANLGTHDHQVIPIDPDDEEWRANCIDLLAAASDDVIDAYERQGGVLSTTYLTGALRQQVAAGEITPVCFGSAISGVGVPQLLAGVRAWLPSAPADAAAPLAGEVFKIAHRPSGEKLTYVRLFAGTLEVRQRLPLHRRPEHGLLEEMETRVTGIELAGRSGAVECVTAGDIAILHGLRHARIGDRAGLPDDREHPSPPTLPLPALESVVRPADSRQITRLRAALEIMAEHDPLIALRQRNTEGEISLRLYGEVQKEVIQATLAQEYGVAVTFGPTMTICIERPDGVGEHIEPLGGNPIAAGVGLRIEPVLPGSGVRYERELGALPLAFYRAIEETIYESLSQGLAGWEVTDCLITLIDCGYYSPVTVAADFRKLTPLVVMQALLQAGTTVYEPIELLDLDVPEDTCNAITRVLTHARATIRETVIQGNTARVTCTIPTAELRGVEQQIPGLTRGEGTWVSTPAGHIAVSRNPPTRSRTGPNPFSREGYLAEMTRR
ncbi:MAG: translation factor GTPase family protein [Thermomicrobiales bacterium]